MEKRWYDKHNETLETLEMLKNLDISSQEKLSEDIINVATQIKTLHREETEPALSIGIERVLGLYQTSYARRWYDKKPGLNSALRTISTLPEDDFLNIMEGLYVSIKE